MSLDTKSMSKRIEPNKVDRYCIDLEDYENINDLINRSIRTKTKFVPDHIPGAEYDSDKDIADLLGEQPIIDQSPQSGQAEATTEADAKRSDGKAESIVDPATDDEAMPLE